MEPMVTMPMMYSTLSIRARLSRLALLGLVLTSTLFSLMCPPIPVHAQVSTLPGPACALIGFQVICYDALKVVPRVITPADQRVTDFAIAPDGEWLAYRAGETLQIVSIDGTSATPLDSNAPPPTDLDLTTDSIAWSPTGLAIGYATANGLRIVFCRLDAAPQILNVS